MRREGQRQNSRVRTKRERNFGNEVCTVLWRGRARRAQRRRRQRCDEGLQSWSPVLEET